MGDIVSVLGMHLCVPFPLLPQGQEGVMLRVRTTEAAALQTLWSIIHGKQSHTLCLESQEGVLSLRTWDTLNFLFFIKKIVACKPLMLS